MGTRGTNSSTCGNTTARASFAPLLPPPPPIPSPSASLSFGPVAAPAARGCILFGLPQEPQPASSSITPRRIYSQGSPSQPSHKAPPPPVALQYTAKKLAARLSQLGAKHILDKGMGDDQARCGYYAALDPWLQQLWAAVRILYPLPPGVTEVPHSLPRLFSSFGSQPDSLFEGLLLFLRVPVGRPQIYVAGSTAGPVAQRRSARSSPDLDLGPVCPAACVG